MEGERQTHRLPRDARGRDAPGARDGVRRRRRGATPSTRALDEQRRARSAPPSPRCSPRTAPARCSTCSSAPCRTCSRSRRRAARSRSSPRTSRTRSRPRPIRERAMNNLDRFIRGIGVAQLLLRPAASTVPSWSTASPTLFAASEYLSGYMATHPRLIEPIFSDPNVLVLSRDEMRAALAADPPRAGRRGRRDDAERELDALRLLPQPRAGQHRPARSGGEDHARRGRRRAHRSRRGVRRGARSTLARTRARAARDARPAGAASSSSSAWASSPAASSPTAATSTSSSSTTSPAPTTPRCSSAQEYYVRLAQKLIWALQTRTSRGRLLPDRRAPAAVRQSGHAGHLARQLRRTITPAARRCGNARRCCARARSPAAHALADAFRALRREILLRPLPADAGRRDPPHPPAHGERAGARDRSAARFQDRPRRPARRRERRAVPAAAPRRARIPSCSRSTASPRSSRASRASACWRPTTRDAAARLGLPAAPVEPPAHRREPLDLRPRRGARRSRRHRACASATRRRNAPAAPAARCSRTTAGTRPRSARSVRTRRDAIRRRFVALRGARASVPAGATQSPRARCLSRRSRSSARVCRPARREGRPERAASRCAAADRRPASALRRDSRPERAASHCAARGERRRARRPALRRRSRQCAAVAEPLARDADDRAQE